MVDAKGGFPNDSDEAKLRWLDGLAETVVLADGRGVVLRPLRPEDEEAHFEFATHITPADAHFRFFRQLSVEALRALLSKFTRIDYEREMAFIAVDPDAVPSVTLGVVRAAKLPESDDAELAILVRSDMNGLGLGRELMRKMIEYSRNAGTRRLVGDILANNHRMLRLSENFGFRIEGSQLDLIEMVLDLRPGP
jgi:acetyltransferase